MRQTASGAIVANKRFRILNWIGIVDQLAVNQANRLLDEGALPFPQFKVLLHLQAQMHRKHTVTDIAQAFQQPQPGTTKTVQKLEEKGFVVSEPHPTDGRARLFSISAAGSANLAAAQARLTPMIDTLFAEWTDDSLDLLFRELDRLKTDLDRNRPKA